MLPVKRFFPDPEPGCPDECEEIRDGEDLTACRCSPEFLADLPGTECEEYPEGRELEDLCEDL